MQTDTGAFEYPLPNEDRGRYFVLRISCASDEACYHGTFDIVTCTAPLPDQSLENYLLKTLCIPDLDIVLSVTAADEGASAFHSIPRQLWAATNAHRLVWPPLQQENEEEEEEEGSSPATPPRVRRLEIVFSKAICDIVLPQLGEDATRPPECKRTDPPPLDKNLLTTNSKRPHPQAVTVQPSWSNAMQTSDFSIQAIQVLGLLDTPVDVEEAESVLGRSSAEPGGGGGSYNNTIRSNDEEGNVLLLLPLGTWVDMTAVALAYTKAKHTTDVLPKLPDFFVETDDDDDDGSGETSNSQHPQQHTSLEVSYSIAQHTPSMRPFNLLFGLPPDPFDHMVFATFRQPETEHLYLCFLGRYPPPQTNRHGKIVYNEFGILYECTLRSWAAAGQIGYIVVRTDAPDWMKMTATTMATTPTQSDDDAAAASATAATATAPVTVTDVFKPCCTLDESMLLGTPAYREAQWKEDAQCCAKLLSNTSL